MNTTAKTCFVIMPFSDMTGYDAGHFGRVYEHLIKPACIAAGLSPVRGDEVKGTNYIAIDILQRILQSDIVVCDLSGKNPNVMYELGIRQAFDLPVVLLKDHRTERVFDIQGLRTLEYSEALRVDSVASDREQLKQAIIATLSLQSHEVNSLVRLLGVQKATLGAGTEVSAETGLILSSLKDVSERLAMIEEADPRRELIAQMLKRATVPRRLSARRVELPNGEKLEVGREVYDSTNGKHVLLGSLESFSNDGVILKTERGESILISPDDDRYMALTSIPF